VRRSYASFTYQVGSWAKPHRVVPKVEWHPGELYPRAGFIATNMARPSETLFAFYKQAQHVRTMDQRGQSGKTNPNRSRLSASLRTCPGGCLRVSRPSGAQLATGTSLGFKSRETA
jgi:hypothetical protein